MTNEPTGNHVVSTALKADGTLVSSLYLFVSGLDTDAHCHSGLKERHLLEGVARTVLRHLSDPMVLSLKGQSRHPPLAKCSLPST